LAPCRKEEGYIQVTSLLFAFPPCIFRLLALQTMQLDFLQSIVQMNELALIEMDTLLFISLRVSLIYTHAPPLSVI
jgi:hypothetical protein